MKVLIVSPHLSTGGLPQYLLEQVKRQTQAGMDVTLVEYQKASDDYVVQREKLQTLFKGKPGRFATLDKDKDELLAIIQKFEPDVIHFAEIPELFCDQRLACRIYGKKDRSYRIVETTHTCAFDPRRKIFTPDRFVFASPFSLQQYGSFRVNQMVAEYSVEPQERPNRTTALEALGLDPEIKHVLNVGLFSPGKNQAEAYEMARELIGRPIQFHFIGNQAPNFQEYWRKLRQPVNCRVWGEQSDMESFYGAMDVFLFTSVFELNPLVLKEALAWRMPVLMHDLQPYLGRYQESDTIQFLTDSRQGNIKKLLKLCGL